MTIEELFTEEYKKLKKENERLVSQNNILQDTLTRVANRKIELEWFIRSLEPKMDENNYNGLKYIYFSKNYIPENNDYYKDALFYVKDVKKKEGEK